MYWPKGSELFNRPNVKHLYNKDKRCTVLSSMEDTIALELVGEEENKRLNYEMAREIAAHVDR